MNSVAIYVRLSEEDLDKQGHVDSRSIANQKDMLTAYCKEREWDIYDIYCDDGITGMERDRPEFQRMLKDCEDKKVNIVLCKDQSRFARDKIIITEYLQTKFIVWGIRFIGVADNVDSTNGYFLEQTDMNAMFNEWYVRNTAIKINAVFDDKRKQGKYISPFVPYGYIRDPNDKHHLIPDENVRDNVVRIFNMYISGQRIRSIATVFNQEGIPSPATYKNLKGRYFNPHNPCGEWTIASIQGIVRNEVYTGTVVQGKTKKRSYRSKKMTPVPPEEWVRVPNMHEPLITQEMWEKAQKRSHERTRAGKQTHEVCPFTHKVICGECGELMTRRISYSKKGSKIYYAMYCSKYFKGMTSCTNKHVISGKYLESECLKLINNVIHSYCNNDDLSVTQMQESTLKQLSMKKQQITVQREKTQKRIDSLYMDKLDGVITQEDFLHYKERFSIDIAKYDEQLADTEKHISQVEERMQDISYRQSLIDKYSDLNKLDYGVVDDFIESITVGKMKEDGSRDINFALKI